LGDRAVIGAKNLGIRAANERDNLIYQAKVLEAKLSPAMATPEGIPLRPMPEPPTQRPLIPMPEKQQPLMMNTNNPDGPQGAGPQGKGTTQQSEHRGSSAASQKPKPGSPEHKTSRWQRYAEQNKDNPKALSYEKWSNRYEANMAKLKDNTGESGRPSWRQSEQKAGEGLEGYQQQTSFKDGEKVPYGTKGSVRPEYYKPGHSIEVKNYDVQTPAGKNNVVQNVSKQITQRTESLPPGTSQTVIIDIRGQNVSTAELRAIKLSIAEKTGVDVDIKFKTK
jgi:hypothetical protein